MTPYGPLSEGDRLRGAAVNFRPGVYRHWKGHLYRALFLGQDSTNREGSVSGISDSTQEPLVIYISLDVPHQGNICVRSLEQWNEYVTAHPCAPNPLRSNTCELGTNSCPVNHRIPRFEWVRP